MILMVTVGLDLENLKKIKCTIRQKVHSRHTFVDIVQYGTVRILYSVYALLYHYFHCVSKMRMKCDVHRIHVKRVLIVNHDDVSILFAPNLLATNGQAKAERVVIHILTRLLLLRE